MCRGPTANRVFHPLSIDGFDQIDSQSGDGVTLGEIAPAPDPPNSDIC